MTTSDVPPPPPGSTTAGLRWPAWAAWAALAILATGTALLWVFKDRTPAPEPALPPGWTRVTTGPDGLTVDLPAEPTKNGPVETLHGGSDTSWLCVANGYTFGVRKQVSGVFPGQPNHEPDDFLNGFCDGLRKGLEPDEAIWQEVTVAGRAGREMRHRGTKAASIARFVQIDRTLYFFLVGAPTPDSPLDGPDVMHFFDSVRFAQ